MQVFSFDVDKKISPVNAGLCMALCAFLWSFSGALVKMIDWNGMVIACMRSLFAGVALWLYLKLIGKKLEITKNTCIAAITVCIKYICFIVGNKYTSSANMIALQYTNPVLIIIISFIFLKQKPRKKDAMVAFAAMAGIFMLTLDGKTGANPAFGNTLGVMVGVSTALMYIVSCKAKTYQESLSIVTLGHIYTAVLMAPFVFTSLAKGEMSMTVSNWGTIIFLGLIQQALAYVFYCLATRSASTLTCSLIASINPMFNPIWAAILINEIPGPITVLGFIIVIGSITIWSISNAIEKGKLEKQAI